MLRERKRRGNVEEVDDNADDYSSQEDGDDVEDNNEPHGLRQSGKRRKVLDESYRRKCRERNREHARNTRERKKQEIDLLQARILTLTEEVRFPQNFPSDTFLNTVSHLWRGWLQGMGSCFTTLSASRSIRNTILRHSGGCRCRLHDPFMYFYLSQKYPQDLVRQGWEGGCPRKNVPTLRDFFSKIINIYVKYNPFTNV